MTALAFAFGAGLLSTVNPCGFALLPAFLAFSLGERDDTIGTRGVDRLGRGFGLGLSVSVGFAGVFLIAGLLLSYGLRTILTALPWTAVAIGVALATIGLATLTGRHVALTVPVRVDRGLQGSRYRAVLFGAAYAVASLSCTVAVFLAVVAQALAASSAVRVVGVFAAYAAGATTIIVALTVSTALARGAVVRWVRGLLPLVSRIGGIMLLLSGVYLVAYWLPQALHPGSLAPESVASIPQRISADLTTFVADREGMFAGIAAVLLVAGVATAVRRTRHHEDEEQPVLAGTPGAVAYARGIAIRVDGRSD